MTEKNSSINEKLRYLAPDWAEKFENLSYEMIEKIIDTGLKISRGKDEGEKRNTIHALGSLCDSIFGEDATGFNAEKINQILGGC